jgi:hypothetical protein
VRAERILKVSTLFTLLSSTISLATSSIFEARSKSESLSLHAILLPSLSVSPFLSSSYFQFEFCPNKRLFQYEPCQEGKHTKQEDNLY